MAGGQLADKAAELAAKEARIEFNRGLKQEKGKLSAAAYDRASTALFGSGIVTPAIAMYFRAQPLAPKDYLDLGIAILICLFWAVVLHLYAQETLEDALK
ncbi:hypothetical protein RFM23_27950 [Mesorhizobium abyssinicae]|uniref:Uncharacterized protein n=1 Tax=Mesorhizobium abyssinicae TaxID=1209958 RepID=A0ABU5AW72_9HYPH|nr:hypothetical protein [Mesorhizobium abyssinicae]MDX8541461.1 hypothetical protein [Mesorhizobium abyssinicae]